jgi:hypothetical protein
MKALSALFSRAAEVARETTEALLAGFRGPLSRQKRRLLTRKARQVQAGPPPHPRWAYWAKALNLPKLATATRADRRRMTRRGYRLRPVALGAPMLCWPDRPLRAR